jgi:hypothetical protein
MNMKRMTVQEIEEASRSIVTEFGSELSVLAVSAADGESDHAEVLIEVRDSDEEPSLAEINVPRCDSEQMAHALRKQLSSIAGRGRSLA